MPCPQVYVLVDGSQWYGWKSLRVSQSIDQAAHSLQIETSERESAGVNDWNVNGGSRIEVLVAPEFGEQAQPLFQGYVRLYEELVDGNSHTVNISAESDAIDIAEGSHLGPYFWREGTRQETIIDQLLEPYGLPVKITKPLKIVPKEGFRVGVNETPLSVINKIAEKNGLATFTDSTGEFVLSDGSDAINLGTGYQTGDYVKLSQTHDLQSQFSEVIVKAQKNERTQKSSANFEAQQRIIKRIQGHSLARYRPSVFISNGEDGSQADLDRYIRDRLIGQSLFVRMDVKSPFTKEGPIWGINQQLRLSEPRFNLLGDYLRTVQVEHAMDNGGGYTVSMDLTVPEALSGSTPLLAVSRSRSGWFSDVLRILGVG
jgi:prophage tail gpP-like protein